MTSPMLLIDGKNCLYRAVYANMPRRDTQHPLTMMLTFISSWMKKFNPSSVHVFWDCPRKDIWRMDVLPTYKARSSSGRADVGADMAECHSIASELLPMLGVKQYSRKGMEADDLIYSACRVFNPHPLVVCSSDSDYHQLPYSFHHVTLYDPMRGEEISKPDHNPAILKALIGDKSDNIDGFAKIGKVRGTRLAQDSIARRQFLMENGIAKFTKNMLLIDLGLNPHLLENDHYIIKASSKEPAAAFDQAGINVMATKHKIKGLLSNSQHTILPFKRLFSEE